MSLYDDLGVPRTATPDEIKGAGKRMAKQHHPDRGGDAEAFDRARKALVVLSDPQKREEYDRTGRTEFSSDPEADELREAGQMVMQGMVAVLQDAGLHPEHTDVAARIRQHIDKAIKTLVASKRDHEVGRARIDKFLGRLKVKKGALDPVGSLLREQQAAITAGLANIERQTRIAQKAKEIAAAYSYKTDPKQQPSYELHDSLLRSMAAGGSAFFRSSL